MNSNQSMPKSIATDPPRAIKSLTTTLSSLLTSSLDTTTTTESEPIIIDDAFYGQDWQLYNVAPKASEFSAVLIILVFLFIVSMMSFNIFYIIANRKMTLERSASYQILLQYFVFKILFCLAEFLNIFSSIALSDSLFYIMPSNFSCYFTRLSTFYIEVCQNFQLLLLWVILLSERKMLGFKYLNSDFELKKALRNNQQAATVVTNGNLENATVIDPSSHVSQTPEERASADIVRELGTITPKNVLILNSRHIVLFVFYLIMFTISFYPRRNFYSRNYGNGSRCFLSPYFDSTFIILMIAFVFLFFLPIFYWLMALSIWGSKNFGGPRDPILKSLSESEIYHLKFIKAATIIKFFEQFFLHIIATHDIHVSKSSYMASRIIGLSLILLVNFQFMYYESVFMSIRRKVVALFTNQSINYRAFRNRGVYEETVDYRNLVEST